MEWSGGLPAALVAAVSAGISQLVAEGYVREAVLPALGCVASSSITAGDRASKPDRAALDALVQRRMQDRPAAFLPSTDRQAALRRLLDDVADLCEIIARD